MAITAKAAKKLREIYFDTEITIYLRDMNVISVSEDQQEIKVTAMRQGYVIDVDTNFFYLGLPNGEITCTVSHDLAQMVEIMFAAEFMDEDMMGPGDEAH
jgi:hypothetical protein